MSLLARLCRRLRESGLLYTVQVILNDYVPDDIWRVQKVSIWGCRLSADDARGPSPADVRWAGSEDAALLVAAGYPRRSLEGRLSAGCRAVLLTRGATLLGISWYVPAERAPWEYHWVILDLPPNGMWNFDVWVSPAHRGEGIGGRMIAFAHRELAAAGITHVHSSVDDLNRNSIRVFQKSGYRRVGGFLLVRILNAVIFRSAGASEWGVMHRGRKFQVPGAIVTGEEATTRLE